jgi:hypothetical protein
LFSCHSHHGPDLPCWRAEHKHQASFRFYNLTSVSSVCNVSCHVCVNCVLVRVCSLSFLLSL